MAGMRPSTRGFVEDPKQPPYPGAQIWKDPNTGRDMWLDPLACTPPITEWQVIYGLDFKPSHEFLSNPEIDFKYSEEVRDNRQDEENHFCKYLLCGICN